MFSGIVEAQTTVLDAKSEAGLVRIIVQKPSDFDDLKLGDSIATNGVCLTVEAFDAETMTFALGAETLQVTGWTAESLKGQQVNLERSLRLGDRIHGHMVTGHVDATGKVLRTEDLGGSLLIEIAVPKQFAAYVWRKGSWAVNGVSLTVNSAEKGTASVCLIPETLKRTNLGVLKAGDRVNIEVDWMARGLLRAIELGATEFKSAELKA